MASIPKKDLPAHVRRCWKLWRDASKRQRDEEELRLKFYVGGDLQWRDEELTKRRAQSRPWITDNRCKPAVDQIEGDIRQNPPGPQVKPVGDGADGDTADIIAGLIREVEYRSAARTAYSTAGKYVAASGLACLELETEWANDRSIQQQLVIKSVEDPNTVFFDPSARMANRQDAAWAGKLKIYTKPDYIARFGSERRILKQRNWQVAKGWIQEAIGIEGDLTLMNEWTGYGDGPYFVAEFYQVETNPVKMTVYSDNIGRFEDEPVPAGLTPKEGDEYQRTVPRRKVTKYLVDAFEVLDETPWLGDLIPLFPVLGPEVYINGKLHRLSVISGAIDNQRALNYVATTATEIAGLVPKSPWVGFKGQFDDPRWQSANSEVYAYLEVTPTFATDETSGAQTLLPAPQRNQWEAPIQWVLALAGWFVQSIKAVTSVYDPSLGQQQHSDQSGKAIQQLRSESNTANFSYSDNLHRAIEVMYDQMLQIFPQILDGPRVVTIVRPDSQHELQSINQEFPDGGVDPKTGQPGKSNHIGIGRYAVRVLAGPNFETRQDAAVAALTGAFQADPRMLAVPGVAAKFIRLIAEGNPKVEGIADLLEPPKQGDPQQVQQQLQQTVAENQTLKVVVQRQQQELEAQLPKIEADKWKAAVSALAGIEEARIKAGVDNGDRDQQALEHFTKLAHETALKHMDQEHEEKQADKQAALAVQSQASDHLQEQTMQENAPKPTGEKK